MTELLQVKPGQRVLEIGTGSGYQAAVLAELKLDVYSIEIVEELANLARATLARLGYENVHVRAGDGYLGWPAAAPFDAIIVTAAPPRANSSLNVRACASNTISLRSTIGRCCISTGPIRNEEP